MAATGAGALLAIAASIAGTAVRGTGPHALAPAGPPAWWVIDRDADALYGLDDRLILARRSAIPRPIDVLSTRDGGGWILRSDPRRESLRLVRIGRDGAPGLELPVARRSALASTDGCDVLVIEEPGSPSSRLVRFTPSGGAGLVVDEPRLTCACVERSGVVVGSASGEIRRVPLGSDPDGFPDGGVCTNLGAPIVALALAGEEAGVYVLIGESGERLARLGADLETRWVGSSGSRCSSIAPTPDAGHVWVVDVERCTLRRFSSEGSLEVERADPALLGAGRAVATESGGLAVATPGALISIDANGRIRPGQGGFVFLSGADRIGGG